MGRLRVPCSRESLDAVIVGAGPNGLTAAVALARVGLSTLVVEAKGTPGGGARSLELTLPGFVHDVCSTVHPLGVGSPFFRLLPLDRFGLEWIQPSTPLAHLVSDGTAVLLERSLDATAQALGADGEAYRALLEPYVTNFDELMGMILGPLRFPASPLLLADFGLKGLRSLEGLVRRRFVTERAPALLAGLGAHGMLPLDTPGTASFALVLAAAGHAVGWPVAKGGSQAITNALVGYLRSLGGELALNQPIESLDQLPSARAYLLDVSPKQLVKIAGAHLPREFSSRLARYRYGAGVFKMDFALRAPIPWRDPNTARAGTVHLGGSLSDVAHAEDAVHRGRLSEAPFVLLVQPTLFDAGRAPNGMHVAWAYCHAPRGSALDASDAVEAQIERFAPGFKALVVARATRNSVEIEDYNPNYVGGDINGGVADLKQLFFRPVASLDPYATPAKNIFLCSSATPPGGGVHGMCGYWAARSALKRVFEA